MSTNNPMTLPSASTPSDEQLRVLAAEAQGIHRIRKVRAGEQSYYLVGEKLEVFQSESCQVEKLVPDYLTDANAAKGLLEKDHWDFHWDTSTATVAIFRPEKTYVGEAPDFCRAIVLAFLRAEGKIL